MIEHSSSFCPKYQRAVELIGKRWSGAILRALLSGASRFNEICAIIPGLTDKMLSERLAEFEQEQLVIRQVTPGKPVRVDYVLTEKGRSLEAVVSALAKWANSWIELDRPAGNRDECAEQVKR